MPQMAGGNAAAAQPKYLSLNYNEYIVYDESQIRIRYMIHLGPKKKEER
jgi:hypothetical protein